MAKAKVQKVPIHAEHIIWLDHSGGSESWTELDCIKAYVEKKFFIHTVGFVVAENKERVVLVQNLDHQMLASHHMTLLKTDIVNRKRISKVIERLD